MHTKDTGEILQATGLSKKESLAYLALLKLGDATAYAVAKQSGLKTPTAYVILDALREKGMVLKIPKKRGWLYRAKDPDEFFQDKKQNLDLLAEILPLLRKATAPHENENDVLVFEGLKEAKEGMWYGMNDHADFVGFYASAEHISPAFLELVLSWNEEIAKVGVSSRAIVPQSTSPHTFRKLDAAHLRTVKEVAVEQYPSNTSIEIHNSFVRIMSIPDTKIIIIRNKNLCLVLRHIFEMVWGSLA